MEPVTITDQSFEEEVLKSNIPVLVDFWAPWCGPCHIIAPTLEEIAKEYTGKVKIAKLNVDENPDRPMQYNVMSIPNLKIFKDGQVVDEIVGVMPKQMIVSKLTAQF